MNNFGQNIVYYSIVNKKDIDITSNVSLPNFCYNQKLETQQAYFVLEKMLNFFSMKILNVCISENGKPYFKNSNIFFNYSHSRNYIACAISINEVGIDIEETSRNISDNLAEKYLDNEKNNRKKIEKWVKKEAYSKLKGLGFLIKFQNINLNKIYNKNIFIDDNDYMCCLYSECNNVKFKELHFDGANWYE